MRTIVTLTLRFFETSHDDTYFAPYDALAAKLLPHALDSHEDGSHDLSHLARVWKNAAIIQQTEGGDAKVLCATALLHDCVSVEKIHLTVTLHRA